MPAQTPSEGEAMLALADVIEESNGLVRMLPDQMSISLGVERTAMVVKALRAAAQPGMREALKWIADQRDTEGISVSDICTVADRALVTTGG